MTNVSNDMDLQKIDQFAKNISDRIGVNAKYHNIYLIKTYDESGNVIDEKYGMNLFTDHGLLRVNNCKVSDGNKQFYMIFGTGNVTPDISDVTITNLAFAVYPQISMSMTRYPMQYDSATDLISQVSRFGSATLDYNLSGVTEDVEITHFGIFSTYDSGQKMMVHSKVYNYQGVETSFTKRPNEKVTITVFLKGCLLSSLISDAYNNGVYISFVSFTSTLLALYDSSYIRMMYDNEQTAVGSYFYGYIPGGSSYRVPFGNNEAVTNHERTSTRVRRSSTSTLISQNYEYVTSLAINWDGGMSIHADVQMDQPEEISCDCVYTEGNQSLNIVRPFGYPARRNTPMYFNSKRRADGFIPVNDFVITSMYMWDYSTKDWTIQEQFNNPAPGKYVFVPFFKSDNDLNGDNSYTCWASSSWKGDTYLWINDADGVGVSVYIRTNKHPDIPIKRFVLDSVSMTVYGTDTYWDGSTYVKIPAYASDIPAAHRNFKYYLFTQDVSARALYDYPNPDDIPHIVSQRQPFDIDIPELGASGSADETALFKQSLNLLASTTNGWIATFDHIVYPYAQGGPVIYSLRPYGDGRGPMKNHVLIDVDNNINDVTWQSGRFDTSGNLVADSYAWYTDQIFDITGYQHLCWQGVFEPTSARGDRIIFYLYDADENFISLINSTDTNTSGQNLTDGIFDNLPDNVKYVRFGYWRKYGYGSAESPAVIKKLSYCELFQYRPALNKRYATKDRIVMTTAIKCHGSETAYRPSTASSSYTGQYSHCNILVAKVGNDPTVQPEFQLINFPFHAPYTNITSTLMYNFDEYTGLFVISMFSPGWQTGVPRKIFGVDLYGVDAGTSDPFDNDAEMFYIGDGWGCKLCKQHKWCAYFDATDYNIIHAYDMENRTEICTFTIDSTYTIDKYCQLYTVGQYIHVPCKNGTKETVILCDIDSQRWEEVEGFTSPTLYKIAYDNWQGLNQYSWDATKDLSLNFDPLWADDATTPFTDGNFIALQCEYNLYGGSAVTGNMITADNPRQWSTMIKTQVESASNTNSTFISAAFGNLDDMNHGVTQLILSDDGKHLLGIGYVGCPWSGGNNKYSVFDMGMYLNNGQTYRYGSESSPYYYIQQPAFTEAPLENSVITYFDDGIIAYTPGKFRWSPLACWLPHKVTGTTHTIQSYNNPKSLSGGSITMKISNLIPTPTI